MTELPEISTETLQAISFELISKLLGLWRKPEAEFKNERDRVDWKFRQGERLQGMIMNALRYHPDIVQAEKYMKMADEMAMELATLRKIHAVTP